MARWKNYKIQDPLSHFYFYKIYNPTHTPSQKLILITNINNIKFNSIKFIKIFIKLISTILSSKFYKNLIKFYKNSIVIPENPQEYPQIYPKFTPNFSKFRGIYPPSPPLPPPNLGKNGGDTRIF